MFLIRKPFQPENHELPGGNFPQEHGHRFNSNQYYKSLPNGGRLWRDWLSYSLSSQRFYCLHYMFFGKNAQKSWIYDRFHAWQRLTDISVHEKTEVHLNASIVVKMKCSSMAVLPQIVSIDTAFDSSRRELAFIICYVCIIEHSPVIRERLLGLEETSTTTGQQLFSVFQDICKENDTSFNQRNKPSSDLYMVLCT
ncbi:hypothetical protein QTP88_027610 [Uroleucon formosanum]